jgi:hypothetical protein
MGIMKIERETRDFYPTSSHGRNHPKTELLFTGKKMTADCSKSDLHRSQWRFTCCEPPYEISAPSEPLMPTGRSFPEPTFSLFFFFLTAQSLSLSLSLSLSYVLLSLLCLDLSLLCVWVSVRRKGEDERKEEGGEVSVNEGEGKERKEKRKRMGGGGLLHVAFGRRVGIRLCYPIQP